MMFVCYAAAIGLLAFAYEEPDLFLWVSLLVVANVVLRRSR